MREIVLWGGTGQAKVLYEALLGTDLTVAALVDNRTLKSCLPGVPILLGEAGLDAWLAERGAAPFPFCAVAVGGGRGRDRLMLMDLLKGKGLEPLGITHPRAFVAATAEIGEGCQILPLAAVCAEARLGRGVIVNTAASVDHECQIGDGVHLAPGARLAGEVKVGDCVFIGTGAVVLPRVRIGADAVVGAGAVVTRDVPPGVTVVGNPARLMQKKN